MRTRPSLFERLTPEGRQLVPVNYYAVEPVDSGSFAIQRLAESDYYRSTGFFCWSFNKPISKCVAMRNSLAGRTTAEQRDSEDVSIQDQGVSPGRAMDGQQALGKTAVFVLFACCVPVRGARRSIICDLQRACYHYIPNGLYEILTAHRGRTVEAIKAEYGSINNRVIDDYFAFLLERELGFWCDDLGQFPTIDFEWQGASRITNAVIDVNANSCHNYARILAELDDLGCKALEVRFFCSTRLAELEAVLEASTYGRLRSIDLLVADGIEISLEALEWLVSRYQRVSSITIHSAAATSSRLIGKNVRLYFTRESLNSPTCCGQIRPHYFSVNLDTFSEAKHLNTCLNQKISIDARGEIKNCPSMDRSFGNVNEVSLHNALAHRDFKALWDINKDQIDICKDCEFRYICTDCRAYLIAPDSIYSKPAKCPYDPYTATWSCP